MSKYIDNLIYFYSKIFYKPLLYDKDYHNMNKISI